jgi:hypothetical protein
LGKRILSEGFEALFASFREFRALSNCLTSCQAAAHVALGQVFAAVLTCQAGLRVEPGYLSSKLLKHYMS